MESHEEKLHKMVREQKIQESKEAGRHKAKELERVREALGQGEGRYCELYSTVR